jgi:hypothetical protein
VETIRSISIESERKARFATATALGTATAAPRHNPRRVAPTPGPSGEPSRFYFVTTRSTTREQEHCTSFSIV